MSELERLFGARADVLNDRDFRVLLLTTLLSPLGTGIVSPILDSLTGTFSVSPGEIGLLVAAVTAPGIVVIPLAGRLADHYGRKTVLIVGCLLFGVGGGAIGLTTDFRVVLALRLIQGFGFSGIVPTTITAIGDLYDGSKETTAQGIRFTVVGVSQVVFPILAGSLVVVAWQYPFLLYTAAIPTAIILYLFFEEPTDRGNRRLKGDGGIPGTRDLIRLLSRRRVAPILLARSLPSFIYVGYLTYNSLFVVRLLGGTPWDAGFLVAIGGMTFAVTASQAGRITTAVGSRFTPLVAGHLAMAIGFGLFAFAPSLPVAAGGGLLGSMGFGMTGSLYRSIITGLASDSFRGGLVSIGEALGRLAATLAPLVIGTFIDIFEPTAGFAPALRWGVFGASIVLSLAGIVFLVVGRTASAVGQPRPYD